MTLESDQRRKGRLNCSMLECQLGTITDFSSSGVRIRCRGRRPDPGQLILLQLACLDISLNVWAKVVWVEKCGLFRHEIGFTFVELTPQLTAKINQIARVAVDRRVLAAS